MKIKTVILIGATALALVVVIGGILLGTGSSREPSYADRIAAGQRYFEQGDYDKAILEFMAAIEDNAVAEDGYVGLATVYRAIGNDEMALTILENGRRMVGDSERIHTQLLLYYPEVRTAAAELGQTVEAQQEAKDAVVVLDTQTLAFFSSASFSDYQAKYPDITCTMSGDSCVVRTQRLDADIIFYDTNSKRIIDRSSMKPYEEFLPNEIVYADISSLFGGVEFVPYDTVALLRGVSDLRREGGNVEFQSNGCIITVACDENGTIHAGAANRIVPTGERVSDGDYSVAGIIVDAATGSPVPDAQLTFSQGFGSAAGGYETKTGFDGRYRMSISETGNYTVTVEKSGYITESFNIYVTGTFEIWNSFAISPTMGAESIRFVLTWGASPSDLDSHLNGSTGSGARVAVSYSNQRVYNGETLIAELDVDDTNGYGPETTTLYDTSGSCYFDVVDFTESSGVGQSGAVVKIYKGNNLVATAVPPADVGFGWRVCKIENGELTLLNSSIAVVNGWPVI